MKLLQILKHSVTTIALSGFAFSSITVDAKNVYRYKNAKGQTILVGQLNKEAIAAGYDVINDEGKLVQSIPPGKTLGEEQDEKKRQLEEKQRQRELKRQTKRDAELLRSFSSVEDIMRARDAALSGVSQRRDLNQNEKSLLIVSLEDLQRQAADYERLGKPIPPKLTSNIANKQKQIAQRERNEVIIKSEEDNVKQRYERDMIRYKELQAKRLAHRFKKDDSGSDKNSMLMMTCRDQKECHSIWQLAQVYAQKNASGRLEVVTDTIILTSAPKIDTDMGLSFSKLPAKRETQIILEVSCNNSDAGAQLCKSSEAKKLATGFEDFVTKQLK